MAKLVQQPRAGGMVELERNNLICQLRELQLNCISDMRRQGFDVQSLRGCAERYAVQALNACGGLLGRGENVQHVCSAVGFSSSYLSLVPNIGRQAPQAASRMQRFLEQAAKSEPARTAFMQKCVAAVAGSPPFSAETAAMAELALNMNYFTQFRAAGRDNKEARQVVDTAFIRGRKALFDAFEDDGVNVDELMDANQAIVTDLVLAYPEPYVYMFNYIWDEQALDFSDVRSFFASNVQGKGRKVYQPSTGGLSYLHGGGRFLYRFSYRPVYTPNMFDDMIFEEMKVHFGPVLRSKQGGEAAYLKSAGYLASMERVRRIRIMMKLDNYTADEIERVMRAASNRCEMYYSTETDEGRAEWAKAHPEEAAALEAERQRREGGNAAKREHIKISSAVQNEPREVEWLVCPADENYEPELMRQAGSKLAPGVNLRDTFTEADYAQLAGLMAELAESIDPFNEPFNMEKHYVPLKSDPDICLDRYVKRYFRIRMDPWQRRRFDLINMARRTCDPLLDKEERLVAVRSVGNLVNIGETGSVMRGESHVGFGCWVDTRSGVTNSNISGNVLVMMQSSIKDSSIRGAGIIANSIIKSSDLSGVFEPSKMRQEEGLGGSAVRCLTLSGREEIYNEGETPEEARKNLENAKRQALLRAEQYKDKTVDAYVEMLADREQAKQVLQKGSVSAVREMEEEKRRKNAELSRQMSDTGLNHAKADEISGQLRRMGVSEKSIRAMSNRAHGEAAVDSVNLAASQKSIVSRHQKIMSAVQQGQRVSEKQAAAEVMKAAQKDGPVFPGGKAFG